jgi:hypothetical protein
MNRRLVSAAAAIGVALGASGLFTTGVQAGITANCKGVIQQGHTVGWYAASQEDPDCSFDAAPGVQNYAVTAPSPWTITAYHVASGVLYQRVVAHGGAVTDPNRPVHGTFTLNPGEKVQIHIDWTCEEGQPLTIKTPAGTIDFTTVCANPGGVLVWS